jgi:rhodanese-related sulfurtransferase
MKSIIKTRKAQLFIIEAFIAVSVMIIMVTALYEVQLATQPPPEVTYYESVYTTLNTLDDHNVLDNFLYAVVNGLTAQLVANKLTITQAIYASLPDNGEFNLYCENMTTSAIITGSWINQLFEPSSDAIGIEYLLLEANGVYLPCIFHLQVWLKGV